MKRIGVDVGGTFTDLILVDEAAGRIAVDKVPSTPSDPSIAVVEGVRQVCEKAGTALEAIDLLLHGTTVATNIAIEHKGAEVGLITTEGFRDILHIARHKKPYIFHCSRICLGRRGAGQAPPPPHRQGARNRPERRGDRALGRG